MLKEVGIRFGVQGAGAVQGAISGISGALAVLKGQLASIAVTSGLGAIKDLASGIAGLPKALVQSREEISKGRQELLHSFLDPRDLDWWEEQALNFSNKYAGTTTDAYLRAAFEIQSGIGDMENRIKKSVTETALNMAKLTQLTQDEGTDLIMKMVHSMHKFGYPDMPIPDFAEKFAAQFHKAVGVGVFRGPKLREALRDAVPVLMGMGWDMTDMLSTASYLVTSNFEAPTAGVVLREFGQRIKDAKHGIGILRQAVEEYQKSGDKGLKNLLLKPAKHYKEAYDWTLKYHKSGFFKAGMMPQFEELRRLLDAIPEYARGNFLKKIFGEHPEPMLQTLLKGLRGSVKEMHEQIGSASWKDSLEMLNNSMKESVAATQLLEQGWKNVKTTAGKLFEDVYKNVVGGIVPAFKEMVEWLINPYHLAPLQQTITSIASGFWKGLTGDINFQLPNWLQTLKQEIENWYKNPDTSMFERLGQAGEYAGKRISQAFESVYNAIYKIYDIVVKLTSLYDSTLGKIPGMSRDETGLKGLGKSGGSDNSFGGMTGDIDILNQNHLLNKAFRNFFYNPLKNVFETIPQQKFGLPIIPFSLFENKLDALDRYFGYTPTSQMVTPEGVSGGNIGGILEGFKSALQQTPPPNVNTNVNVYVDGKHIPSKQESNSNTSRGNSNQ